MAQRGKSARRRAVSLGAPEHGRLFAQMTALWSPRGSRRRGWRSLTSRPFEDATTPSNSTAPEDRRIAYTEAAVERLLHVADAGLRAAAMLELRWSDVATAGATIRVRAKGQKMRTAGLTEDALQALQDWRPSSSNEHVFPFRTAAAGRYRLRELSDRRGRERLQLLQLRCQIFSVDEVDRWGRVPYRRPCSGSISAQPFRLGPWRSRPTGRRHVACGAALRAAMPRPSGVPPPRGNAGRGSA